MSRLSLLEHLRTAERYILQAATAAEGTEHEEDVEKAADAVSSALALLIEVTTCPECGTTFQRTRDGQGYCSQRCQKRAVQRRIDDRKRAARLIARGMVPE